MFVARAGRIRFRIWSRASSRFIAEAVYRNIVLEFMNYPLGVHGLDNQYPSE
jgi:hypothetical protein